jgi:hypothetical protein
LPNPAQTTAPRRTEICPPERLYRLSRWRGGLRKWLNTGWDVSSPVPLSAEPPLAVSVPDAEPTPFADIRREFADALDDIDTEPAAGLRSQIERARSPRELWHLRSALYTLVATFHTESQAQLRMGRLNRHFPHRDMRPGLGTR